MKIEIIRNDSTPVSSDADVRGSVRSQERKLLKHWITARD